MRPHFSRVPQEVGTAPDVLGERLAVVFAEHAGRAPMDELVHVRAVAAHRERRHPQARAALRQQPDDPSAHRVQFRVSSRASHHVEDTTYATRPVQVPPTCAPDSTAPYPDVPPATSKGPVSTGFAPSGQELRGSSTRLAEPVGDPNRASRCNRTTWERAHIPYTCVICQHGVRIPARWRT